MTKEQISCRLRLGVNGEMNYERASETFWGDANILCPSIKSHRRVHQEGSSLLHRITPVGFLAVQRLRLCPLMQGVRVRLPDQEELESHGL